MSGTVSLLRKHHGEIAWLMLALASVAMTYMVPIGESVPFDLLFVGLTLLYGLRIWTPSSKGAPGALIVVCGFTAILLHRAVTKNGTGLDELSEVPLMAAMLVVVVRHAWRSQKLAHELRTIREREREFMKDFAHAVRTTITIAQGHAEMIQAARTRDDAAVVEEVAEDAEIILEELDYLGKTSNRLLLLANAQRSDFLEPKPVALEAVLDRAARRWKGLTRRRWRVEAEPTTVLGDGERLGTMLDALIENAVQHSTVRDTVALSCHGDGDTALIEISDTGQGIDQERLPHVFDRYARAEDSRGCGLGLAIVKAIVEAHHGAVEVTSQAGVGTTFSVRLPRADLALRDRDPAPQAPTVTSRSASRSPGASLARSGPSRSG